MSVSIVGKVIDNALKEYEPCGHADFGNNRERVRIDACSNTHESKYNASNQRTKVKLCSVYAKLGEGKEREIPPSSASMHGSLAVIEKSCKQHVSSSPVSRRVGIGHLF